MPQKYDNSFNMKVVKQPLSSLNPNPRNARIHSKKQIQQIANSLESFGFTNPVLIDCDKMIVAGHGRIEAAKLIGLTEVPTLCLDHLTPEQIRAYVIADNKIAENAGWDEDILAIEFQNLIEMDTDFDITVTGFETAEIDLVIETYVEQEAESSEEDTVPLLDNDTPLISAFGDLWQLGDHLLLCVDSREDASYQSLMGDEHAQMIFTDPPYNVPIDGHVCGGGAIKHDEFAMASGEMTEEEFTEFLTVSLHHMAKVSVDGSLHYICMDWRHIFELTSAARNVFDDFKNLCVWNKANGGMGSLYRSKHELVFVFKKGAAPHVNNVELGRHGRNRTNVWDYAGVNGFGGQNDLAMHPTVKPVQMVADAILDVTNHHDIVLDPFAGSGTLLIAAEQTHRRARCIEFDPGYVDTAIKRWEVFTGQEARHAETQRTYAEMASERSDAASNSRKEKNHVG